MNVIFYHSTSDKIKVDKSLTTITTLSCDVIDDTSILRPRLKVKYNPNLLSSNYIYIPSFNRYYFITNITTSKGYLWIDATVDVLMSFKTEIRATKAIIKRQERQFNKYLNDEEYQSYAYEIISAYAFNTPFTKASVPYLTLLGGDLS